MDNALNQDDLRGDVLSDQRHSAAAAPRVPGSPRPCPSWPGVAIFNLAGRLDRRADPTIDRAAASTSGLLTVGDIPEPQATSASPGGMTPRRCRVALFNRWVYYDRLRWMDEELRLVSSRIAGS